MALLVWFFYGGTLAVSVVAGGALGAAATLSAALISLSPWAAADMGRMVGAMYLGELVKLVVVVSGFILALVYYQLPFPSFLGGFGLALVMVPVVMIRSH